MEIISKLLAHHSLSERPFSESSQKQRESKQCKWGRWQRKRCDVNYC